MFKVFLFSLVISLNLIICLGGSIEDNTELVLTFFIHRHGDRTPVESSISYSTDPDLLEEITAKYGYGQLTEVGINRGYLMGQFLRKRYDELLSPAYNRSEIYIRSTESTRARMTALAALAAVYPASENNWSSEINWTPVPYTTVAAKYDYNLAIINCPTLQTIYYSTYTSTSEEMEAYTDFLNVWSEYIDYNITAIPVMAYSIYDVYTAQMSMGVPLTDELQAIFPEIAAAARAAINVTMASESAIPYMSGPLLNEFFTVADQIIAGEDVQRVQWYSAHDVNVFAFLAATRITPRPGVPKYASMYALELRKDADGNYLVVPVYLQDPSVDELTYLQMDGCDGYCDLETFRSITSAYVLDEDTWRTNCGFTANMVIDDSSVA